MPAPKYYCDYCDKQFQDTLSARRRHLQGIQHQRAKKAWFDSFRDPSQFSVTDFNRGVCSQYMRTGACQYGFSCKYMHPGQLPHEAGAGAGAGSGHVYWPATSMMRPKLSRTGNFTNGQFSATERFTTMIAESDLPPSLRPPPEGGYPHLPVVEWG